MFLLIPESEVSIVAPCGPGNVELVKDSQHVLCPLVGQFAVYRLIYAPLTAEQLKIILLGSLDGILEVSSNPVDIPLFRGEFVFIDDRLD